MVWVKLVKNFICSGPQPGSRNGLNANEFQMMHRDIGRPKTALIARSMNS